MNIDYTKLFFNEEIVLKNENAFENREIECSIELRGIANDTPDCKIGHFGFNFWFRTPYGIKGKKYSSVSRLKSAVERTAKKNGFTFVRWITVFSK